MVTSPVLGRRCRLFLALFAISLLALLTLSISACSDDPQTSTTLAIVTGDPTIVDGVQFGFVIEVTETSLVFDPAEWFSGDEARAAARADGFLAVGEDLDDPYYIRNNDETSARLQIDPTAKFTLLVTGDTGEPVNKTITLAQLAQLWAGNSDGSVYYSGLAEGQSAVLVPMDLTISGGKVIGGTERYMP